MTSSEKKLRVCLLQFAAQENVAKSMIHLEELVEKAVSQHQPHIIALPECFATEYNCEVSFLESVAETIKDGQICRTLSTLSKKFGVYIVGGSIAERDGDKFYNTATVWNRNGELIARHRKVHLCDIHYENGVDIVEVNRFSPGNDMTTFEVNGIKCGVAICYDGFFEEFIKMYTKAGCEVLFVPAAYERISVGPRSWEIVHRARASGNQFYVAAISPARDEKHKYVNYGYSMVVDPDGNIQAKAGIAEEILFYEMDLNIVHNFRKELPLFASRRLDVYNKMELRVCLLQFASQENVAKSMIHLKEMVERAVNQHQPHVIALSENFATECITDVPFLESVAETIEDGQICRTFSTLSKKFGVYIVGGSIVERDGDKMYNTSTVWNPNGELIARHRKVHLCDIHYENGVDIVEVNRFSPGNDMTTFEVNGIKCGVAICYDGFFEEFIKMYAKAGCEVLFIPAAYERISIGPRSWEIVHRARASENQFYVAAISSARDEKHNYVIYGHSMVVDPNGDIQAKAGIAEEILFYEMDLNVVHTVRKELPLFASRRLDVYKKQD
ncbi:uncharacterized protein LOC129580449 [Sitodiplosis mosellana]|uniref:uncharacterized protein LOC129580449 n=1 Tax=Sitodiplosis mosellana TaxID=263140 RepID=UPI002443A625|nr:uncharacterized protein LOC129580449 [Sitodiplosis mosellana]